MDLNDFVLVKISSRKRYIDDLSHSIRVGNYYISFGKILIDKIGIKPNDSINVYFNEKTWEFMIEFCEDGIFKVRDNNGQFKISSRELCHKLLELVGKYPKVEIVGDKQVLLGHME